MEYYLLYNLDELVKEKVLNGYKDEGFSIAFEEENVVLVRKLGDISFENEDVYIKILFSTIKRNTFLKDKKVVINLSKAFEYGQRHTNYKFSNRFNWYVRKAILEEIIK